MPSLSVELVSNLSAALPLSITKISLLWNDEPARVKKSQQLNTRHVFVQDEKTPFDIASRSLKSLLQNIGAVERT